VRFFNRIDARVSEIIEEGIAERLYLLRVKVPRLSNDATGMIHRVHRRYDHGDSRERRTVPMPGRSFAPND
jgi:hypothetical protein